MQERIKTLKIENDKLKETEQKLNTQVEKLKGLKDMFNNTEEGSSLMNNEASSRPVLISDELAPTISSQATKKRKLN
jgi:predicted nuclease with TOPRIM domain